MGSKPTLAQLAQIVAIAVLYYASGQASFSVAVSSGIVTPVIFAAEGFALAGTILFGRGIWPGVFLGQLALALSNGLALELAMAVSASNSLEAVIGGLLFHRFKLRPALDRMRDLIGLLALIVLVLQPFSASIGNVILWAGDSVQTDALARSWFSWWLGNAIGQIIVTPMLLSLVVGWRARTLGVRELTLSLLPTAGAGWSVFHVTQSSGSAIAFAVITPLIVLMAVRFGMAYVTLAATAIGSMALYYTHLGVGPFVVNGESLAVDLNIFLLGIALTGQLIAALFAERQAAERALRDSEAKFHTLYDSTSDAVMLLNEKGFFDCNKATLDMFGCGARDEFCSYHPAQLSPPTQDGGVDSLTLANQHIAKAMQTGSHRFEWTHIRVDTGAPFPAEVLLSAMNLQGEPILQATVRDIAERKRIEQMKSEFVSTVSHELRTPLTSISGALGLIAGGALGAIPDQAKQMLDIAHKNSQRLTLLINDLLDMEKLVAGKMHFDMQPQPLMPLLEHTLDTVRAYGEKYRVRFNVIERADDAHVLVDGMRLQQVLGNFLSNAAKFSPEGGSVEVTARQVGDGVRVEVIDHGRGIPPAFRGRIFQKFSQADSSDTRQKGGTGLGLAISKEIIERMNGTVGFSSEEGHGACFYFELPLCDTATDAHRVAGAN